MRKIRVLFPVSSSGFGGGENYVFEILKKIDRKRYECGIVGPSNSIFMKKACVLADYIHTAPFFDNADLYSFFKLAYIMRDYDIIHANLNRACLFSGLAGKLQGKTIIGTMHGIDKEFYYKYLDTIIFLSDFQTSFFSEKMKKYDSRTIKIGIDSNIDVNDNRKELRERYDIPENAYIIGILARLHRLKGIDILLKAFSIVLKKKQNARLVIIGDGPEKKAIMKIVEDLGIQDKVTFTGALEKPWENAGNILDMFVLPSLRENIPLSILEACVREKIVIASNAGGISEQIHNDCIVSSCLPDDYSEKIIFFMENTERARQIIEFNRKKIEQDFDIGKMVRKLENLYEEKYNLQQQ